jgi:hypothetical protein
VLVAVVPMILVPTTGTIGLALVVLALFLYGGTQRLAATGAGVLVVLLDLETAWQHQHLTIEIAAALSGLALLAAFELRSWAEDLARTPTDRDAYRAKARQLGTQLVAIAVVLAGLVVLAHGFGHGPLLGLLGGLTTIALGAGLVWLSARPNRAA